MITLYTTGCINCKILEKRFIDLGIEYSTEKDINKIYQISEEHGIASVPIVDVNSTFYTFKEVMEQLNDNTFKVGA